MNDSEVKLANLSAGIRKALEFSENNVRWAMLQTLMGKEGLGLKEIADAIDEVLRTPKQGETEIKILAKAERPAGCETLILAHDEERGCFYVQYVVGFCEWEKRFDELIVAKELFVRFAGFFADQTQITNYMLNVCF